MSETQSQLKRAIIALGSNSSDSSNSSNCGWSGLSNSAILCKVIERINCSKVTVLKQSALIETVYQGQGEQQPNYTNAVILVETILPPLGLLLYLQAIEVEFGRPAPPRLSGEPRTIDLDIVDYEGVVMRTSELTLPHPRAKQRDFVLEPLREIAPNYVFADEADNV